MLNYRLASQDERGKYAPELVGKGHVIVFDGERFWVIKHLPHDTKVGEREMLGYMLGCNFANVAEVRRLSHEEHESVKILAQKGEDSSSNNTCLVRLGGSYTTEELPCKTLEEAVARELVYSIWIRRRDTHVDNRVYVDGIPIFFDHHISFFAEPKYAHSTAFFKVASDHGHPFYWRVKEITGKMNTIKARGVQSSYEKAYHYVNDIDKFKIELKLAEKLLKDSDFSTVQQIIKDCGFGGNDKALIEDFLTNNLKTLSSDIMLMNKTIYSN